MKGSSLKRLVLLVLVTVFSALLLAQSTQQTTSDPVLLPQLDGSHDFDFLIGDWKAHVRRLPDRLNNSNVWVEYDGISNHHKILDSNSNFEEDGYLVDSSSPNVLWYPVWSGKITPEPWRNWRRDSAPSRGVENT